MTPISEQPHDQAAHSYATSADRHDRAVRATNLVLSAPAGAFTASVLLDVLSLVATSPEEADRDERRAADLLRLGLGTALSAVTLEIADSLRPPIGGAPPSSTRDLIANGMIVAIYLLAVAERQKQVSNGHATAQAAPLGLSLLGLALLAISGKLA